MYVSALLSLYKYQILREDRKLNRLTVAYPQNVFVLCSMDSNISTATSNRNGSFVAWYRYMQLSISSAQTTTTTSKTKQLGTI